MDPVAVTTHKQKVFHWLDQLFKDVGNARSTIMKLKQLDMAAESDPWQRLGACLAGGVSNRGGSNEVGSVASMGRGWCCCC